MGAHIVRELVRPRAAEAQREIALDLTPDEIVLYEWRADGGWRRFGGVALEDPEFLGVIGLLRAEAEGVAGAGRPVRLWLPAGQVLRLTVRIEARQSAARLGAAFHHACRQTGHAAEELAVAASPPGPAGETTLLVTYAATWHEARDYAARWGFVPGPVSTRHAAEDFGPEGPEFRIAPETGEAGRHGWRQAAWVGLALAAMLALPAPAAGKAPGAAPLPETRAEGADTVQGGAPAGGLMTMLPPPRPGAVESPPAAVAPDRGAAKEAAAPRGSTESAMAKTDAAGTPVTGAGAAGDQPDPVTASGDSDLAAPLPAPRPLGPPPVRPARVAVRAAAPASLFTATAAAAGGPRLDRDHAALMGVLDLDSERRALIRLPGGTYRSVRVGDVLEGWEVRAIGPESMQVARGSETVTLLLVTR